MSNFAIINISYQRLAAMITLLSDLGTCDTSVTVSKAVLARYAPDAAIVDISHHVPQFDLEQAAYLLLSAYRHFSKGTVHLLAVDVFAGNRPKMLLAEKDGYFFIAPDNGILPLAFGMELENTRLCFEFGKPLLFSDWVDKAGQVVEKIFAGSPLPFSRYEVTNGPSLFQPAILPGSIDCSIRYIDRYENVVLDITRAQFNEQVKNRPFKIKVMRTDDITVVSNNYNDVPDGGPLCRFNDAGFLEIALNHAPAASLLGLSAGHPGNLRHRSVKIFLGPPVV